MTAATCDLPARVTSTGHALRRFWDRHGGLDGVIRVGGAVAVVVTIEALAGYFLWRGTTERVLIPLELGWALQFGLTGGSVVGTRAFHRGRSEDKWWGLATSLLAVMFVVADASIAALLLNGIATVNAGWLAVGVLVEILVIGYLTVHTLMAAPLARRSWGPPAAVKDNRPHAVPTPPADTSDTVRMLTPRRPLGMPSVPGWTKTTARARAGELGVSQAGTVAEIVARIKAKEAGADDREGVTAS